MVLLLVIEMGRCDLGHVIPTDFGYQTDISGQIRTMVHGLIRIAYPFCEDIYTYLYPKAERTFVGHANTAYGPPMIHLCAQGRDLDPRTLEQFSESQGLFWIKGLGMNLVYLCFIERVS